MKNFFRNALFALAALAFTSIAWSDAGVTISGRTSSRTVVPILVDSSGNLSSVGQGYTSQVTLTRTADTNVYTAGDVIGSSTSAGGAVLEFTNMGLANGHIIITDYDLEIGLTAVPSGMTSFRLHLYNATPPGNLADNAAWDLPSGDRTAYLGYIDLGTAVDVGSSLFVQTMGAYKKLKMGASTSLFAYLVTQGGYTPAASTVKLIRLNAIGVQ